MHQQQTAFENIVGKEEIARNEQFLLFPQCFLLNQKIVSPFVNNYDIISLFAAEFEESEIGMWGKGLNPEVEWSLDIQKLIYLFTKHSRLLTTPKEVGLGKHRGKRRKCWWPAFSPFPTEFSTLSKGEIVILSTFNLLSANAFNLVTYPNFVFW